MSLCHFCRQIRTTFRIFQKYHTMTQNYGIKLQQAHPNNVLNQSHSQIGIFYSKAIVNTT